MKFPNILLALPFLAVFATQGATPTRKLEIFDNAVFYDGYKETVVDKDLDDGILRHTNYLYAKKLSDADLDWFGPDLTLKAVIGAACDNYDRIGNINIAFVPKGSETYVPAETSRIEVARFITPFMNKNASRTDVAYFYELPALSNIFLDMQLREKYDLWLEFEVFGIPYAAQTQVKGCEGREDVFLGSLTFLSRGEAGTPSADNVLVPVVMKTTEIFGPINFNNYNEAATDTLGVATRTYSFTVPEDLNDARLTLITSNHGANEDGEEYNRRRHLFYFDNEIALDYTPGGVSCEPYRKYNTQGNMIYGGYPDMDFWLNYSNWCPGAPIPIREIHLGALKAGEHTIMLRVPDAVFNDRQGDFYVSAYVQGSRKGTVPSGVEEIADDAGFKFTRDGLTLRFEGPEAASEVCVYSYDGSLLYGAHNPGQEISLGNFGQGIYIVSVRTADGRASVFKMPVR